MGRIKIEDLTALLAALVVWSCLFPAAAEASESPWYPVTVEVWQPPFKTDAQRNLKEYLPLSKVEKNWHIYAFIPHLKDPYWLGVNYGLIQEARRLGLNLTIFEAGGYTNLNIQRQQISTLLR